MTETTASSGGSGTISYIWEQSTNGGATWTPVAGATGTSYNPSSISQTTQYRRGVKRSNCSSYIYSNTVTKTVGASPSVNAGNDKSITVGNSATITATASSGTGNYTYTWDNGLGNGATKTVSPTVTTTYTVTATDANGCTSTDNITISVVSCNLTANPGTNALICPNSSTILTATASNGTGNYTYSWDNGLGNGATKTVSPTTTTTYTVTVTDAGNCTDTKQVTVTISPLPTATMTKTDAICGLNTGTITFTFPNEPLQDSIIFSYDGGNTYQTPVADNTTSATYNGFAPGTYSLYVKWNNTSNACPVSLGNITIGSNNDPTYCNPDFKFQKSLEQDTVLIKKTVFYTFTFINNSGVILNNVQFTDNLNNNALFFSDPAQITNGLQVIGNTLNASSANLILNNIPLGTSSFKLAVDIPNGLPQWSSFCNQAQISNLMASHPNLPNTILSDNPKTPTIGDTTCAILKLYENCCNGIDDDSDGLCDKDDPDCK
jgi:uncharacterized repeat protein (TIGR01451 family)